MTIPFVFKHLNRPLAPPPSLNAATNKPTQATSRTVQIANTKPPCASHNKNNANNTTKNASKKGNCGIEVDLPAPTNPLPAGQQALAALFAEEPGLVLEVGQEDADLATSLFAQAGVRCSVIGKVRGKGGDDLLLMMIMMTMIVWV